MTEEGESTMKTPELVCRIAAVLAALLPAPAHAAGLLKPAAGGAPLAIESHEVNVEIIDGIAVTRIEQVFRNDSARPLEAVYSSLHAAPACRHAVWWGKDPGL